MTSSNIFERNHLGNTTEENEKYVLIWKFTNHFVFYFIEAPGPPIKANVTQVGLASAKYTWGTPTYDYRIRAYQIEYGIWKMRPEPLQNTSDASNTYLLSNLESGTEYAIRVRAITEHEVLGKWTTKTSFVTGK